MAVSVALASGGRVLKNVKTHRYTRSRPDTTAAGAHPHVVATRPENFISWWAWGVSQAPSMQFVPPLAVHSESGDRDDWGNVQPTIIRGLPFTRAFEAYVWRDRDDDRKRQSRLMRGPFSRAMSHLYSRRGKQTDEFKIAYAVATGESDPEIVRIVLLGSPHREYFEATAVRALAFIYDKVQSELAEAKDPPAKAGAA